MQKLIIFFVGIIVTFNCLAKETIPFSNVVNGREYITLQLPNSPEKEVIEFFSFYCNACYLAETKYELAEKIKQNLPKDVEMKKYHITNFGGLSEQLSEAWAIANVLDIADEVEKILFNGIHKNHSIKTVDDIKRIFEKYNISSEKYESMKKSISVQSFLNRQKNIFYLLKPTAVPSFYVNGKYKILSQNLTASNTQSFISEHLKVITYLINHDKK